MTKPALFIGVLFALSGLRAQAQKLPNVQPETGVRAPADIKIDGKTTEWANRFKAYNHATDVFYTISNDDEKLYLTVHATEPGIIAKLIRGGLVFTISNSGNKNDKLTEALMYPVIARSVGSSISSTLSQKPEATDKAEKGKQTDSLVQVLNTKFNEGSKFIQIAGFKNMTDSLISIYNEDDIKAAGHFDYKEAFTCELAIPLKYLGLSVTNAHQFMYNIKINGYSFIENSKILKPVGGHGVVMVSTIERSSFRSTIGGVDAILPTDFWGEYVLAKK